jgi:hypothetical protein
MSITLLFGCFQVETCVRDLDAARAFIENVLGGGRIEQQLAKEIGDLFPGGGYRVDHLDCGQATFQLNEPSRLLTYRGNKSVHQRYLDRCGPCVTNLNFYVDDIEHARAVLSELGAPTLIEGPSSAARSLADYGPGNTRAGADTRPFLFMGARPLIGLDLEIMEPNFLRFADQRVQYPCFAQPRPVTGDQNLRLQRLRIVVHDLESTYDNLVRLFTPGSRSRPFSVREGPLARVFRVGLGGIELEYLEPAVPTAPLAQALERHGPGVVALDFAARDVAPVLERARASKSIRATEALDLVGEETGPRQWQLACRDLVGFDVLLEEHAPHFGNSM